MEIQYDKDELYQGYLAKVYQGTFSTTTYSSHQQETFQQAGICLTYGELLYPSVKKIIKRLHVTPKARFLDLGSGLGKCALQIFLQTTLSYVHGMEAALSLHQQAIRVRDHVEKAFPCFWERERQLIFEVGNFLEKDWQNPTIVYTCSTCFTQELLVAIGNRINAETSIEQVFSLRPLPTLSRLTLTDVFKVECSWDSALCFYYT